MKNKYRVSTTISPKHQEILKKYVKEYGTQQSVLEHALESLGNSLDLRLGLPPDEEALWIRIGREIKDLHTLTQKDITKLLFETADLQGIQDYIADEKPVEFSLEWFYNKPLKECSLQEIMEGIDIKLRIQGGADTINFTEDENSYTINITHSMGIKCAKILEMMDKSVFKTYGVEFETQCSERSIFYKVFKQKS